MIPLTEAEKELVYEVQWLACNCDATRELRRLGVRTGVSIMIISKAAGAMLMAVGGRRIAVSSETAAKIKVE